MAVSQAVRAYYTQNIFLQSGRDKVPRNYRPLDVPPTGKATVEGCAGGGKNILELFLLGSGAAGAEVVDDLRASCGLCNPAMYAAADVVCEWARGKRFADVLAVEPAEVPALAPLFDRLGGPGRPDDAREKFQYVLAALRNAIRSHRGEPPLAVPSFPPPVEGEASA
jgi:hypothetical protein